VSLVVQMVDDLQGHHKSQPSGAAGARDNGIASGSPDVSRPELPLFEAAGKIHSRAQWVRKVKQAGVFAGLVFALSAAVWIALQKQGGESSGQPAVAKALVSEAAVDGQKVNGESLESIDHSGVGITKTGRAESDTGLSGEAGSAGLFEAKAQTDQRLGDNAALNSDEDNTVSGTERTVTANAKPDVETSVAAAALTITPRSEVSKPAEITLTQPKNPQKAAAETATKKVVQKTPSEISLDTELFDRSSAMLNSGLFDSAMTLLRENVSDGDLAELPKSAALYAEMLVSSGDLAVAEKFIVAYRTASPGDSSFIKQHIRVLIANKKFEQAELLLNRYSVPAKVDSDFLALRASIYQQTAQWPLAVEAYSQLLQVDAGRAEYWLGLAIAQDAGGEPGNAAAAYQRALLTGQLVPGLQSYARSRLANL